MVFYKEKQNHILLMDLLLDSIKTYIDYISKDSISVKNSLEDKISFFYYSIAEIESFRFNHIDDGIIYFNIIVNEYPNASYASKSLFSLYFLYDKKSSLFMVILCITSFPPGLKIEYRTLKYFCQY